ncbi:hypothetical protein MMC27_002354 [Xylographa pallens]|nr:hypothetical protein [Xylographa pallens]
MPPTIHKIDKGSMMLNFLSDILIEDPALCKTLQVFGGTVTSMTEEEEQPLIDCVQLYAKQLLLSDLESPNRGYAAYMFRGSSAITRSLVEVAWKKDEWLTEQTEKYYKDNPDFWSATLQHNLQKLAEELRASPDDIKAKHKVLMEKVDDLCKNLDTEIPSDSTHALPSAYKPLRKYLRNEAIYGPFLENIWRKYNIKPSVQNPGSYIRKRTTLSTDTTTPIDSSKSGTHHGLKRKNER